ncbi:hypothetical protein [Vibrio sp. D431a]|uniref:hypothetical protein n=1 Tax=Vibrio sp. D431a TaxID=2837388 RepID=UPI0025550618|nr:hypothetical protein [Vibrio sp. D431a]MDK9793728.1 hypothetical protein [Vibrio sp. D431a]
MALKTQLFEINNTKEIQKRAKLNISFSITRKDVFEIIGKDVILDSDPDIDESNGYDHAIENIERYWNTKKAVETSIRKALWWNGMNHSVDEDTLTEEQIRTHRPMTTKLIDDCINKYLPELNVTEKDEEIYQKWLSKK